MSYPLPIFDSKRRENRPKLFNSSLQQFVWKRLQGDLRLLRTNSAKKTFEENIDIFKTHLMERGYNTLSHTIEKPNFQGATHNIMQKGAFTQRHTHESKSILRARKPEHVLRSRVGLSTLINT